MSSSGIAVLCNQAINNFAFFQKYEKLAKAQLKKVTKVYAQEKRKSEDKEKKEVLEMLSFLVGVCIVVMSIILCTSYGYLRLI